MNPLLEQLHDIEGLDSISWWPLAIGWWVIIGAGILIGCSVGFFIAYRVAFKRSWKNDALLKLTVLEKNLSEATALETLTILSEYLRRIALQRFSRKECAGLVGDAWLKWLSKHDPKHFDWENKGDLLTELPYAPTPNPPSLAQIKELIQATKTWVR